jgi:hypothetical protein
MTLSSAYTACDLCERAYTLALTGSVTLPAGWAPAKPIATENSSCRILRNDPLPIRGLWTRDPAGRMWIAFRGTMDKDGKVAFPQEWIDDALALPMVNLSQGGFHCGAYGAWGEIYLAMVEIGIEENAMICGHSAGAWMACLTSVGFQPEEMGRNLICIEGPKPGDARLAANLSQSHWLVNQGDIVPSLPLSFLWVRPGTTDPLYGPAGDLEIAHALPSVVAGLDKCGQELV